MPGYGSLKEYKMQSRNIQKSDRKCNVFQNGSTDEHAPQHVWNVFNRLEELKEYTIPRVNVKKCLNPTSSPSFGWRKVVLT